jgi:hypothetical protein
MTESFTLFEQLKKLNGIITIKRKIKNISVNYNMNIPNRGTKAGGAKTNTNGLSYEEKTDLSEMYSKVEFIENNKRISFIGYDNIQFINANKTELHKYMKKIFKQNINLQPASGCKSPDEAYINLETNTIYIIEKKFQQTPGSVDEKLQTGHFKKQHYQKLFPEFTVKYIYCLSGWFRREEYKSIIEYLRESEIPIFWGQSETYKSEIIRYICSGEFLSS